MMNRMSNATVLGVAVALTVLSAVAEFVREDELDIAIDRSVVTDPADPSAYQVADLRDRWPVETLGEIGLKYSAVGWDADHPLPAGAAVRLNLQEGEFAGGSFSPTAVGRDLATGLTGTGTYGWLPSGVERKVYRVLHEATRGGTVVEDETLCAYFDFAECEMLSPSEFRGAVLGFSQPVACRDDARHPWSRIGGDGDGLRNAADGATLSFSFTGRGTFAAELSFAAGTVTVALDGATVATLQPETAWTAYEWPVAGYDAHTLTLAYDGTAVVSVRQCALTGDAEGDVDSCLSAESSCDLRTTFPVASLEDKALKGLMYSAFGWVRGAAADATRTATITAQAGMLANGVFTPDGSAELTVLPSTPGEGTTDWALTTISKKVYRLTHTVKKGGTDDAAGLCYGYLDFTHCVSWASQAEVEAAVLGAITHRIAVIQDELRPWQPLDSTAVRSGIETDELLAAEETTATTFTFRGRGVLHYEYDLTGGTLAVVADDEVVSTFTAETADWVSCQVSFEGFGAHEVAFVYTAAGGGTAAAIRNVRWVVDDDSTRTQKDGDQTRVDLREGVRTPKNRDEVLPFAYSSTNWIGVAGATATSKAHVRIVQMTGSDPVVTNWTTEVAGTSRVLYDAPGEDVVSRKLKVGCVWKATFDILNGGESIYREESWFDLRLTRVPGFLLMIK